MNAEEIKVGGYQILTLFLLSVNFVVVAMSHALTIFYKYTPKFYCEDDQRGTMALMTSDEIRNRSYGCGCAGRYVFEGVHGYESPAIEWRLICEKELLLQVGTDAYFVALLLGGCIGGVLADRIGRLPVLAICLYAQGTMAVALNVVQEYKLFLVFRALQGFFIQGLENCTFILCMELFPTKFRTLIMLIILSIRSFGLILLSGLSYGIPDWRILQLVISVPTAVTVLYIWIIPESPRWLLAKEKLTEAEILLEKIDSYNRFCSKKNENSTELPQSKVDNKPKKPKRKTLSPINKENFTIDIEKSLEESKNLLSPTKSKSPRPHTSTEDNEVRIMNLNSEKKNNLSCELDIEEITRASLFVVADENCPSSNEGNEETGPSYLLVSKEALSPSEINKGMNEINFGHGCLEFLKSKFIGRTCIIMMFLWFTSSTTFHTLVSLPQRLSGERHISMSLAAGAEVLSFVLTYLVVSRCGRRGPLCASQILVGSACLSIAIFALVQPQPATIDWSVYIKTTIITFGRIINISTFFILRLLVIELFPTISRGTVVGLCISAEMIGGLLTPYILILNNYLLELGRVLIGFVCIFSSFLCLIFPETLHKILPDSVEAAKNLKQKNKNVKCNNDKHSVEQSNISELLHEKLFSEDWVDAGNGIIVNFTNKKNSE